MDVSWKKPPFVTLTLASLLTLTCVERSLAQQNLGESGSSSIVPAAQNDKVQDGKNKKPPLELAPNELESIPSRLGKSEITVVDLASALNLAGVRNPQILLARERILEATALRQLAAARFLPSLHFGTSFDNHDGNLQQSTGKMLQVNRSSLYLGAGASAVAAGTVTIPGVEWSLNISEAMFKALESRQVVRRRQFAQRAMENDMLLRVGQTYLQMVRAEGRRALALQNLSDANDVVRVLKAYVKAGQGRQSDEDRAVTDFIHRQGFLEQMEGDVLTASARLAQLLDLPQEPRLHPIEDRAVPTSAVPDPVPLPELLTIAILNRPELQEQQAAIRQALLQLQGAKLLPFSPTVLVGYSYGAEGGGSNLAAASGASRFSNLTERADFDAALFWTLQNLGVGNVAQIKMARSNLASSNLELVRRMNNVRTEVAVAHGRIRARLVQIDTCEQAVKTITAGYGQDFRRIRGGEGLPIELMNSLRLLCESRLAYLDAIMDYNLAQMELYVALGQPPASALARPVPPPAPAPVTK
jgi:outer membrane protein TolC